MSKSYRANKWDNDGNNHSRNNRDANRRRRNGRNVGHSTNDILEDVSLRFQYAEDDIFEKDISCDD